MKTQHYGIVYKKQSNQFSIRTTEAREFICTLSPALSSNPAVIGDQVGLIEMCPGMGQVVEILPRRSQLARRAASTGKHAFQQVFAANIDQVVPVFSLASPPPSWNMLDRFLVSAEAQELPSVICLTKADLLCNPAGELEQPSAAIIEDYHSIGYPAFLTSALTGAGLENLQQIFQGRISLLLGKSGAGKTSLLNALQPGLGLRTNSLSQSSGKGQHTTTHQEILCLPDGAGIIDTPGIRELGLWDVAKDDLAFLFPEMRPFIGKCRFHMDCRHEEEPDCAVREAVCRGQISPRRYKSYIRMKEELP